MPRRRAAEHLAVLHREVLRGPVRAAQREGADAGLRGFLEARHVLLPRVGIAHRLAEIVVDDGAARGLGQPRHQAVLQLRRAAAAALDDAGAELAQHVGEREDLFFVGPQRRDVHPLRVVMALVARDRKPERSGLHAVAHDVLHRLDFIVVGGALLALVAHHVIAHRRVADEVADVDAEASLEPVHVLRDRFPLDVDRAQHVHRNRFDIREKLGDALSRCRDGSARDRASNSRKRPWSRRVEGRTSTTGPR